MPVERRAGTQYVIGMQGFEPAGGRARQALRGIAPHLVQPGGIGAARGDVPVPHPLGAAVQRETPAGLGIPEILGSAGNITVGTDQCDG